MPGASDPDDSTEEASDEPDETKPQGVVGREEKETGRLSFSLPPFRLPQFFPPEFELSFPIPGSHPGRRVSARTVLVACLAFDAVDAAMALLVESQLVGGARAFGGLVLAATVTDVVGLAYGWELLAVLFGYPELTVFPTLTVLLFLRARGLE